MKLGRKKNSTRRWRCFQVWTLHEVTPSKFVFLKILLLCVRRFGFFFVVFFNNLLWLKKVATVIQAKKNVLHYLKKELKVLHCTWNPLLPVPLYLVGIPKKHQALTLESHYGKRWLDTAVQLKVLWPWDLVAFWRYSLTTRQWVVVICIPSLMHQNAIKRQ